VDADGAVIAMASIPPIDPRDDLPRAAGDSAAPTPLRKNRRRVRTATIVTILAAILVVVLILLL
jgi:hypothetical protein